MIITKITNIELNSDLTIKNTHNTKNTNDNTIKRKRTNKRHKNDIFNNRIYTTTSNNKIKHEPQQY